MPTKQDRKAFEEAIRNKKQHQITAFLQQEDAKELLLMKDRYGYLPIHDACCFKVDESCLKLILHAAAEHEIIKQMLEEKTNGGTTCLHMACRNKLSVDSLRLLLEYSSEHADVKQMLEEEDNDDMACLQLACGYALSPDSLRLLLEYLSKHGDIKRILEEEDEYGRTCFHRACAYKMSTESFRLLLEYLSKHADIKKMLEEKDNDGWTCLHFACDNNLSSASLSLLLEYLSKHADIKKMLEEKTGNGKTCLHYACRSCSSPDSLRLLFEYSVKHSDIKQMLEEKSNNVWTCLHFACDNNLSSASLSLLFEYLSKHSDIKKMFEEKTNDGLSCLHFACYNDLSPDSLRLLLGYLSNHADIKKMLEEKTDDGYTCLHYACVWDMSADSLRLLISFFPSNESFQLVLGSENNHNKTPAQLAHTDECKQLLKDPDCWRKCRYWLFCNYRGTFRNSLYSNSPEKTLEALKELRKKYSDDETVKKATRHQQNLVEALHSTSHDESAARQVLELEALSTITVLHEDFHRCHVIQRENSEIRKLFMDLQTQVMLLRDELDRQEVEKLIFDRLPITGPNKEAISILQENHVTKESFFLLDKDDLREMGVKIGPRKQLLQIIEQETLRRNNLSARSDLSSRPRSPGHTPRIHGGVPPIDLAASAVIHRYQQQQQLGNAPALPTASKDSNSDEQRSFVATANSEVETVNGGSESWKS